MAKPKLYYKNRLRKAQTGHDGTIYGSCAAAIADADDAFKVRGNIIPATDVVALSALVGGSVIFDATTNQYRITAIGNPYYINRTALEASQKARSTALVVGSYLYLGGSYSIIKIDMAAWTGGTGLAVVGQVNVSADFGLAVDSTGSFLYA